jgi:hypothetical protein
VLVAGGRAYDHGTRLRTGRSCAVSVRADRAASRGAGASAGRGRSRRRPGGAWRDCRGTAGSYGVCSDTSVSTASSTGPDLIRARIAARVLDGGFRDATTVSGSAGARLS